MQKFLLILVLVAALGVVSVEVFDTLISPQQVDAKGCAIGSSGYNGSLGRCFHP